MKYLAASLLGVHAILVGWMSWSNGLGRTEAGHLGAAAYFWKTKQFDVFHVNPPLTRIVISIPLAIREPSFDLKSYSPRPLDRCEWSLGEDFIATNTRDEVRWCTFLARGSLIPFLLLGGYCGFLLSREIYGEASGYLFLILQCFSPFTLAWGATVCPDATAAAMGMVALYLLRRWLLDPTAIRATAAGIALGILPLTKLTWVIAFAVWPLIWGVWRVFPGGSSAATDRTPPKPPAWQLGVVLAIAMNVINLGYGFDRSFQPLGDYRFHSHSFGGRETDVDGERKTIDGNRFQQTILAALPVPVPAEFLQGIDTQKRDFERGLPSYLGGVWADRGWWYYYLYALAVKEPLGNWSLLALAVLATACGSGFRRPFREEFLLLAPALLVFVFVSSQTGFSVNARYVILALPFFYIWLSKVAIVFSVSSPGRRNRVFAVAVLGSLAWSVTSSVLVFPHSLSYFNELAGGPKQGGRHLLGSNFDWGQDIWRLKTWLENHPDVQIDGRICESAYSAVMIGIPKSPTPPSCPTGFSATSDDAREGSGPRPGWYVLSANYLYGRDRQYRYFVDLFEPVAVVGYSIRIYHITPAQAIRAAESLKRRTRQDGPGGVQRH